MAGHLYRRIPPFLADDFHQRLIAPNHDFARARAEVEKLIGYRFTNADLLEEGLHTDGPLVVGDKRLEDNNKMIALVGDTVLDLVLKVASWRADLSKVDRNEQQLWAKSVETWGLFNLLNISAGMIPTNASDYMIATALEPVLGRVYLDSDYVQAVRNVVGTLGLL